MNYFEAPEDFTADEGVKVFLAGGIGNCPDWQQEAVGMLNHTDLTILNPRRPSFPTPWTTEMSREQITWEYEALEAADVILFWFPASESLQPIALFELGSWIQPERQKVVVVGRDPGYLRKDDIDIQIELRRSRHFPVHKSLAAVCDEVERETQWLVRARRGAA